MPRLPTSLISILLFGQGALLLAFGLVSFPQIEKVERDIGWIAKANQDHMISITMDIVGAMFIALSIATLLALIVSSFARKKNED
jgi:hypothetical protein